MPWVMPFSDTVAIANRYFSAAQYLDAAVEYLKAAAVAPTPSAEHNALVLSWIASERAAFRHSELEL